MGRHDTAIARHLMRGLTAFGVPEPITLEAWAREHFYLSAESSYVEQRWSPWWFQCAIMAVISNDDIREVIWRKPARVGATKIILASILYQAQHKRRNQAIWQPTDDDRDEFVKSELEPALRDVPAMQEVFPAFLRRDKDNTLQQKKFLGSLLHLKGGKAAKNYRRISIDTAYLDEYDAFDPNVEKEGDPGSLAYKRVEGAVFPKIVFASTPKLDGFSNIQKREREADLQVVPEIPCPECGGYHPLTWGGKDEPQGFKWVNDDPETVRHLCPHCGSLITQAQYLAVADPVTCRYCGANGTTLDHHGVFRDAGGNPVRPPERIAFTGVWSAYSPNVSWAAIVRDFLAARRDYSEGKKDLMQAFRNTTLGEYWAEEYETTDDGQLRARAEPYRLGTVPLGCLILLASIDTQDNRLEVSVWGYGRGCESWVIDHKILFGNPSEDAVWEELNEYLFETEFPHASGQILHIHASAIDTGGHNTHAVYHWVMWHAYRRVFALKGRAGREKAIKDGAGKVDIDWRGRFRKNGLILWHVGTNHAKDLLHGRLQITRPGPGYIHFSADLPDEWFRQFTGEARTSRRRAHGGEESAWTQIRKRVEAWDCATYATWLEAHLELSRKPARYWDELEALVQPSTHDLFAEKTSAAIPKTRPPTATPSMPEFPAFRR